MQKKKKIILTFFWKADSEWKVSSRNNLNSVRHQLRAFPQPFCSSSPPLTQPKNCWSYKKWLFLWERSPNISRQCSVRNKQHTQHSAQDTRTWQAVSQSSFTKTIPFPSIPISVIVEDNISDNIGSKHVGKFSGHSLSNSQIKPVNIHG